MSPCLRLGSNLSRSAARCCITRSAARCCITRSVVRCCITRSLPAHPGFFEQPASSPNPAGMQFMRRMAVSQAVLSSDYTKRMTALDAIQNIPCVVGNPVLKYLLMDYMDMKPLPLPGSPQSQMNPSTQLMILSDKGRRFEAGRLLQTRCVQSNDRLGALMYDIAEVPLAAAALAGR
ncbi:uncharacterized protein 3-like [Haliotis rubra]|uniref:uncharacterized protein 3-like n=1 Tax=Haliotis rubra TaxID=36100 RepID=UPI001EE53701|nr:uncharacterized protein 3-like [Haliotis rubra]